MEPDGGLFTRVTAAPTSQPLAGILMAEHMAYVARLERRDKKRAQQARKQQVEGIHVPTAYTTRAQSLCIHIHVPMGPRWDALVDEGYAMCSNATVHDMHSFKALVGCVVSLFDSAGSSPEDRVAPPLSLKDSEWPDLCSTSAAPTHGPDGPTKAEPARATQAQFASNGPPSRPVARAEPETAKSSAVSLGLAPEVVCGMRLAQLSPLP
jgi:hypothetical protein